MRLGLAISCRVGERGDSDGRKHAQCQLEQCKRFQGTKKEGTSWQTDSRDVSDVQRVSRVTREGSCVKCPQAGRGLDELALSPKRLREVRTSGTGNAREAADALRWLEVDQLKQSEKPFVKAWSC